MQANELERDVARQYSLPEAPTLLAQLQLPKPIAFSRLRATTMVAERKQGEPREAAFVLMVALTSVKAGQIRIEGTQDSLPKVCPGDTFITDLATGSTFKFAGPYDFVRFYLPESSLNRLADDQHLPRVKGLRTSPQQVRDRVMQGLALSLLPALEAPTTEATRFLDSVALAFHAHVLHSYGVASASGRETGSGLAPWQIRHVRTLVEANLDVGISNADLAGECRLSPSHFGRAFSASMGTSPHKYVLGRRIKRAKALLLGGEALSQIALACGFVDQSHLTRAFAQVEGLSPGRWRRKQCN